MKRTTLRVLQVVLTTCGGLLLLPTAINLMTGGQPPDWLRPYVGWLWPVGIAFVVTGGVLEVVGQRERPERLSSRRPQDPRNVDLALDQVERYVEGRQRGSLTGRLRIALALDERPTSVRQPVHMVQRVSGTEYQLADESDIADVYAEMRESMLLLGAPGAGKTTQLIDLAAALVARAKAVGTDPVGEPPVPVLVDLAEWSRSGMRRFASLGSRHRAPVDFVRWLLGVLERRYHIPETVGRAWLDDNRLTLLLDGLDEVREDDREQCVRAINDLQERYRVTRLAVCCRVGDYYRLAQQLRLQGAVELRLLTREQVDAFLRSINPQLIGVSDLLAVDEELWELLTTPLMLTIMVMAEEGRIATALTDGVDPTERRGRLFDAYVVEVVARRVRARSAPGPTLRALRMLAVASTGPGGGVQVVPLDEEAGTRFDGPVVDAMRLWLSPTTAFLLTVVPVVAVSRLSVWAAVVVALLAAAFQGFLLWTGLLLTGQRPGRVTVGRPWLLPVYSCGVAVMASVTVGGSVWAVGLVPESRAGLLVTGVTGLAFLLAGWYWFEDRAAPPWSLIAGIVGFALAGVAVVILFGVTRSALAGWAVGVAHGALLAVLLLLPQPHSPSSAATTTPLHLRRVMVALYLVIIVAAPFLVPDAGSASFVPTLVGWAFGVGCGFLPGAMVNLLVLQPLYLHSALAVAGERDPWLPSFLRLAVDCSLLTDTDGTYRFVHLLVRNHLAACDPELLAEAVLRRRAELAG